MVYIPHSLTEPSRRRLPRLWEKWCLDFTTRQISYKELHLHRYCETKWKVDTVEPIKNSVYSKNNTILIMKICRFELNDKTQRNLSKIPENRKKFLLSKGKIGKNWESKMIIFQVGHKSQFCESNTGFVDKWISKFRGNILLFVTSIFTSVPIFKAIWSGNKF